MRDGHQQHNLSDHTSNDILVNSCHQIAPKHPTQSNATYTTASFSAFRTLKESLITRYPSRNIALEVVAHSNLAMTNHLSLQIDHLIMLRIPRYGDQRQLFILQ